MSKRVIRNTNEDGDLIHEVNVGGVLTEVLKIKGSDGSVEIPGLGPSGQPFYEEGTWTPAEFSKTNLTVTTAAFNDARWVRTGNTVFATISNTTGYSTTATAARTILVMNTTGLPGVTNGTQFYGGGRTKASGAEVAACVSTNASSTTDVAFIWSSLGTGTTAIVAWHFHYHI